MDLKIVQKKDNPLLSRTEIEAEINFFKEPTPKKEDIKKKLASMEKANENVVIIKHIYSSFATGKADVLAYIYKSEDELKKIEPEKKEKKEAKPAGEDAPTETPKEEQKKEEAPKKEVKEEKKEEAKEEPKGETKK